MAVRRQQAQGRLRPRAAGARFTYLTTKGFDQKQATVDPRALRLLFVREHIIADQHKVNPTVRVCLQEDIFLTGEVDGAPAAVADARGAVAFHAGRPRLVDLFSQVEQQALQLCEGRVAVLVCGNEAIKDMVLRECSRSRKSGISFDPHYEAFGF